MNDKTALELATERLRGVEQLLIHPTPAAIHDADVLLHEAAALLAKYAPGPEATERDIEREVRNFRVLCDRVAKLLEGARKVQWIRLRLITSLGETYTARGEKKMWPPPQGNVNIRM